MKLNIKSWALTFGIFWALIIEWITVVTFFGKAAIAFDVLNQFYLHLFCATASGLILNPAIAFIDASIFGALFAWVYNRLAK